jgi:hypothetical protein
MTYSVSFMSEGIDKLKSEQLVEHMRVMSDTGCKLVTVSHTVVGPMVQFYFFWSRPD